MKKYKILLISLALLFLVIGAVSAQENTQHPNNPITSIIGGLTVSDENTATISFFDENNNAVNGNVAVTVNGQAISASGSSISITASLPTDTASITISNGATSASIAKVNTATSSSLHTDINKNTKAFSVILKDSKGNPIKNQKVSVSINGNSRTVTTDGSGKILVSVKVSSSAKSADIKYTGSVKVKQSEDKKPVQLASKIQVSKQTFKVKTKTKKVTAVLKDSKGKIIKNKKLTLKINGVKYTAKTDSKGKVIFKVTKLNKKGTFTGKINFAGDSAYKPSNANVKIVVKK